MNKEEILEKIHLKSVIKQQAEFIQFQRKQISDLNKINDIIFKGIKSLIYDKAFDVNQLKQEVWQCVEEEDVHSVDSVDVDTKKGGKNEKKISKTL